MSTIITWLIVVTWNYFTRLRVSVHPLIKHYLIKHLADRIESWYSAFSSFLSSVFALNVPGHNEVAFITGSKTAYIILLAIPFSTWLLHTEWDGEIAGNSCQVCEQLIATSGWSSACVLFTFPMDFLTRWVSFFYVAMGFRLCYRLLFMGKWKQIPRRLTAIQGTLTEFLSGYIILVAFFHVFAYYALGDYDPKGTYKPGWTEYLG